MRPPGLLDRARNWAASAGVRAAAARMLRAGWGGVAAGLIAVLALIAMSEYGRLRMLTASVNALSSRLADQQVLLAVVAAPTARTIRFHGGVSGAVRFIYDPATDRGAVVGIGLADPGRDRVYQLWLVGDPGALSAGTFRALPNQPVLLPVRGGLRRAHALAISVETAPRGALGGPTQAPVLTASL